MSKELIERFPEINYSNYDHDDVHVLQNWALEAIDELTKQAEYKRKAEIWDYLYEAIEHTSRLSDELPDGTAGSSKEDIVNASLDVWREQQKKILALEGHIAKQAERIEKLRTKLSAQMHQTQITAQQIHDAVLAAIKRGTTFPDGIDEQGHPIEQLVGMIVTTLQLKLDEQAERVTALEGLVEFFYGQMYMTSPKMNGQHTYRFRSGGWPMTHCVGPTAEAAVEAVMKEIEREKQDQIDRAAALKEGE